MMRKIVTLLFLTAFCQGVLAQQADLMQYSQTISGSDLKQHLSVLASDEYEGRETGEKGQKMAAEYLYKAFKELGLTGPVKNSSNPYFQSFQLQRKKWKLAGITAPKGIKKEILKDFYALGEFNAKNMKLKTAFVGYGIEMPGYSDYKDIDVKGKCVIMMLSEPRRKDGKFLFSGTDEPLPGSSSSEKAMTAKAKGAKTVIFVYENNKGFNNTLLLNKSYFQAPSISFPSEAGTGFGRFYTSPEHAADLLGISEEQFQQAVEKFTQNDVARPKLSSKIQITAESISETFTTENVLGYMEGTDKKDELLVITAHYDHIGIVDGKINNGADDDGSGTVSVLEIAQAFAKAKAEGRGPRRSILFMLVTGEEKGLLGSEYYSENPVFPLATTVTNLNIDMVGRVDDKHAKNPNYIYIIGSNMLSSELHRVHEETAKTYSPDLTLDYEFNSESDPNRYYYRSDHYNFAKHGVPVIFYFNGTHADYHAPGDDVEKINFDKMEKIVRLVFATAWELANRDKRVTVDKQ